MEQHRETATSWSGEIDVRLLLRVVWEGKWLIALVTVVCTGLAIVLALLAPKVYRSEALIQPREETRIGGGVPGLASQLSGFADLAGFSLGGGDRAVALATLRSRTVIEAFITEKNLLPKLYQSRWDETAGKWTEPDREKQPTARKAYDRFTKEILRISEDKKTGLCTVAVEWTDPKEAQQWVTELVLRTNEYLRTQAIQEGEKNLAYLEAQSRKIGQVELQQAIYGLVEGELKKLMMAKGGDEFAIKTIDPAVVPEERARPKRKLMVVIGFLFGGIVGIITVLALHSWRARQPDAAPG
jgi:uncharacterized protein involved in exopolysaccharide biosynthesis